MPTKKLCCIFSCHNSSNITRELNTRCFSVPVCQLYAKKWKEWIAWQNAPAVTTRTCLYVCDEHFEDTCLLPNGRLVVGAVPCKGLKNSAPPEVSVNMDVQDSLPSVLNIEDLLNSGKKVLMCNQPQVLSRQTVWLETCPLLPFTNKNLLLPFPQTSSDRADVASSHCEIQASPARVAAVSNVGIQDAQGSEIPVESNAVLPETPPQNKSAQRPKRNLSDLSPSDFSSLNRAKKYVDLTMRIVRKHKEKLDTYRARRHKLQRSVQALEKIVRHLKDEKKLIKEQVAAESQVKEQPRFWYASSLSIL